MIPTFNQGGSLLMSEIGSKLMSENGSIQLDGHKRWTRLD